MMTHNALKSNNTCLLSTVATPPPYPALYSPNISSLLILHQDQHHFHTNYRCHGNWPKEVITQVISVTDDERLAPSQVLFIRGQVAFTGNTFVCYTCTVSISCSVSLRQIISFRLPVIVHHLGLDPALITLSSCGRLANTDQHFCTIHSCTIKDDTAGSGDTGRSLYLRVLSSPCNWSITFYTLCVMYRFNRESLSNSSGYSTHWQ